MVISKIIMCPATTGNANFIYPLDSFIGYLYLLLYDRTTSSMQEEDTLWKTA